MGGVARIRGAAAVAETFKGLGKARAGDGAVGLAVIMGGQLRIALRFTITDRRIAAITRSPIRRSFTLLAASRSQQLSGGAPGATQLRCAQCASKLCAGITPACAVKSSVLICCRAMDSLLRALARSCEAVHAHRPPSAISA